MKLLIIAKSYHNSSARSIQMRRVIKAINTYTINNVILITEGEKFLDNKNDNLEIINIPSKSKNPSFFYLRLINKLICDIFCLKENSFIKNATLIAESIISNNKIDAIFTVSSPFDSHLVGLKLKNKFTDLKWITFFSDLWPSILLPFPYKSKKLLSNKEIYLMKEIVEKCNILLTTSQYALNILKYHFKTNALLKTVQHCLEENIDSTLTRTSTLDGYIVHSGFWQKERINNVLIDAINELGKEEAKFKGLIHIGSYHSSLEKLIVSKKCKYIFLLGQLPEILAISIQRMVDISLIIEAPMKDISPFMPSKITDSIANSKKVISITPSISFLADFSKQYNGLFICNYEKESIKSCFKDALKGVSIIEEEARDFFHPKNVAKVYDEIINFKDN